MKIFFNWIPPPLRTVWKIYRVHKKGKAVLRIIPQLEREIVRKSKLHFNEEYRKNTVSVPTKGLDEITKDPKKSPSGSVRDPSCFVSGFPHWLSSYIQEKSTNRHHSNSLYFIIVARKRNSATFCFWMGDSISMLGLLAIDRSMKYWPDPILQSHKPD